MKIVVLDANTVGDDISLREIEKEGDCKVYASTNGEELVGRIKDAEVIVTNKIKLTAEVLKNAKELKLICLAATGFDNIDIPYCRENNIAVCNVVGYSSHSVAQVSCALALALSVNLKAFSGYVSRGDYSKSGVANRLTPVYYELFGKTWGIIGYGNIGKEVAEVARALGCRVLVNKKSKADGEEYVDLKTLCSNSDIISIHTPLNDGTRGMIDEEMISVMKKGVILINTARGLVTDEEALVKAVKEGKIGGLGVDVYSVEPFGEEHPFYEIKDLENVILTPHMAWGALESRKRCISEIAENIRAFKRREVRNRVDLQII